MYWKESKNENCNQGHHSNQARHLRIRRQLRAVRRTGRHERVVPVAGAEQARICQHQDGTAYRRGTRRRDQGCIRHRIEGGIVMTLTNAQRQTAKDNDIPLSRVRQRIAQGWSVDKAITQPIRHKTQTHGGMNVGDKFITAVQLQIAEENGLNKDMVRHRVYRGMRVLDAISTEKYTTEIKKHYTAADKKLASDNGVSMDLVYQRVKRGWGREQALSTPPQSNKRTADDTTLLEIGRKKYLNRAEFKDAPLPFFPSELKALKQMGLTIDDVKEVEA